MDVFCVLLGESLRRNNKWQLRYLRLLSLYIFIFHPNQEIILISHLRT